MALTAMSAELEKIVHFAKVHASIDYENSSSAKTGNRAADSIRSIALQLVEIGRIDELLTLLDHEVAGSWIAFIVAESPLSTKEQRERCIELIQRIALEDSVISIGAEMWLEEQGFGCS